jgi:uncharacterized protein YbbC (DUF1343 family)
MRRTICVFAFFLLWVFLISCRNEAVSVLQTGAERTEQWLPLLAGKKVGLLVNQTSQIGGRHLVDTMLALGVDVSLIFVPEHGFRGEADAGEYVADEIDKRTGIPLISLYGNNKRPSQRHLDALDVVIFDIQDVGVRFFTYISSMHYMMEACVENDVEFIVLDRPNPNGDYYDGPIMESDFKSFVGMHPIPVVHGLTVGELALMINREGWLKEGEKCRLHVIEMTGYNHSMAYSLPVKPSPNLPNDLAVRLYPSLCFFEGTIISVGRGTQFPFQVAGAPDPVYGSFNFVPASIVGMDKNPRYLAQKCYGVDYRGSDIEGRYFSLEPFFDFYEKSGNDSAFVSRSDWFNLLAGTDKLLMQIKQGLTEDQIRETWEDGLAEYGMKRSKYLLYPDPIVR